MRISMEDLQTLTKETYHMTQPYHLGAFTQQMYCVPVFIVLRLIRAVPGATWVSVHQQWNAKKRKDATSS